MRERCAKYSEAIIALAEGREDEAARLHVESCSDCRVKLEQLRQLLTMARAGFFDAPASLVGDAKALMPAPERRVVSLLRSSAAWTGARTAAEDFQIVVGETDTQMRIMYARAANGWQVMGKAPAGDWSGESEGGPFAVGEDGRFSFHTTSLAETGFVLAGPEGEIVVPSAEELLSRGSDERD